MRGTDDGEQSIAVPLRSKAKKQRMKGKGTTFSIRPGNCGLSGDFSNLITELVTGLLLGARHILGVLCDYLTLSSRL